MNLATLNKIQSDLESLQNHYEVVLFGSQVTGDSRPDSDYDIAVITRLKDINTNISLQKRLLGQFLSIYDIRIFELYPIHIQISIINNYKVIFGDISEISEYFYFFRKLWDDCKHRILGNQFSNFEERLKIQEKFTK